MDNPDSILPAATPENAIRMQMQFQVELIKRLDQILLQIAQIAKNMQQNPGKGH